MPELAKRHRNMLVLLYKSTDRCRVESSPNWQKPWKTSYRIDDGEAQEVEIPARYDAIALDIIHVLRNERLCGDITSSCGCLLTPLGKEYARQYIEDAKFVSRAKRAGWVIARSFGKEASTVVWAVVSSAATTLFINWLIRHYSVVTVP